MVGAPGGSPAEALAEVRRRATRFHLRHFVASADRSVDSLRGYESEGWAHFEFTGINIRPTILPKKFEDVREARAAIECARRSVCPHVLGRRPKGPTEQSGCAIFIASQRFNLQLRLRTG